MEVLKKPNTAAALFTTFLKIGAFTFGGGYAMIPLIQRETVEKRGWITQGDILEIVAIAESTPGPISINAATFVGYRVGGFWGALAATAGVVLPSFGIILAIAAVLREFQALKAVQYAFQGIRACVLVLILRAMYSMYRQCPKNWLLYGLAPAAFLAVAVLKCNVLLVIACCALTGWICALVTEGKGKA